MLEWLLIIPVDSLLLDTDVESALVEGVFEVECTLVEEVLKLEWELTVDWTLEETLDAELEGEILLDDDEIGCAELDEVT